MEIITENWNSPKCRVAEPSTNRSTVSLLHLRLRDHCEMGREECKSQRIREFTVRLDLLRGQRRLHP